MTRIGNSLPAMAMSPGPGPVAEDGGRSAVDGGNHETGLSGARRRWAAFAVGLAVIISVMDGVMLNIALPAIQRSLDATPASVIWVVNAYQLAVAIVLLPLGKSADIFGHRRVYMTCLAVFTIASVGCALSTSLVPLSIFRFAQGCGGAGILGITNAMMRHIYPPRLLARGIATNSLVVALSLALAPTISSLIVTWASWQWLFLVNLPTGLLLLFVGARVLPDTPGSGDRFDFVGALLCIGTFGLIILALDAKAHQQGLWAPILLGVAGIGLFAPFLRHQLRLAAPLLPVDLLRGRMFGLSVGTMFCAAMAQIMAYVSLPFFFQYGLGRSQIETGLLFLPWPIAIACIAPVSGRLGTRFPAALLCGVGLGVFACGLLSLAFLAPGATVLDIGWRMALCGLGYGFFQPTNSRALITSAPLGRSGSASVMGAAARVLGQASGAALVASIFRLIPAGATSVALLIAAAIAIAGGFASLGRGMRAAEAAAG